MSRSIFKWALLGLVFCVSLLYGAEPSDSTLKEPSEAVSVGNPTGNPQDPASADSSVIPNSSILLKGKTGIASIDTLPVNEWDIKTNRNSLPLTLLFSLFPGGGQYYTEHYVRGGFITAIEGFLIYEVYYNKSFQRDRVLEQARDFQDSVAFYTKVLAHISRDSIAYYQDIRNDFVNRVREKSDKKKEQEDLRIAENSWLFGVHLYSMFDAFGIWYNNNYRSTELRSMKMALLLALIPGFGQMYNGEFGKAGLLYMGFLGASTSVWTSQRMVNYYVERKHVMEAEDATSEDYERVAERVTYYRKNRNQYIWGMALIYLYSIGDAVVDALLSDFDNPVHLAVLPTMSSGGAQAIFTLDF